VIKKIGPSFDGLILGILTVMNLKDTYNRIAEDWHNDHRDDNWWAGGTDAFTPLIKPGGLVLDVGCGGGRKSRYLVEKGFRVVGVDFSEKMIEIAKREVPSGEFHALDLRDAKTLGRMFDGIFMQAVLLHVPRADAGAVIKEMAELLAPGGCLYIAVKERRPGQTEEALVQENDYGYPYERFFSYFTLDEIIAYMQDAGLVPMFEQVIPAENTRWIEVIGKKNNTS